MYDALSNMVVLFCKLGKGAFLCYFARNDMILLSLIEKRFYFYNQTDTKVNFLHHAQTKMVVPFRIFSKVTYVKCAISHIARVTAMCY